MPRVKQSPVDLFKATISAAYADVSQPDLSDALGKLLRRKLAKPRVLPTGPDGRPPRYVEQLSPSGQAAVAAAMADERRRKARRVGKYRRYTTTTKVDHSRVGTFRRYMIATIRAHGNTALANAAHAVCDNPKFSKNKLDFNWAADSGYIT